MLVRVGSMQTNDEFWINPEHVISLRIQKAAGTAIIKLSDGTTHNIQMESNVPITEADALKLLHGRSASKFADLLAVSSGAEKQNFERRTPAQRAAQR